MNYLLSDTDHLGAKRSVQPEILAGRPETTIAAIDSIKRKHKYVSGAIAFRDNERPTSQQIKETIQSFRETVCPGLDSRHYNCLFVRHEDKGNTEIHFLFPSLELTTGKRLCIHPPGERNIELYEAFVKVMNEKLGYDQVHPDPLKLALSDFERKVPEGKEDRSNKLFLHKRLIKAIRKGEIRNRDELCRCLNDEFGIEITRKGADYISVKFPGAEKAKRLRGPLYYADADYAGLLESIGKPPAKRLMPEEFIIQQYRLNELIAERRQFFSTAYLQPPQLRSNRSAETHKVSHRIGEGHGPIKNNYKENTKMDKEENKHNDTGHVIAEVLGVTRKLRTGPVPYQMPDTQNIVDKIKGMRESSANAAYKKTPDVSSMGSLNEIMSAIGEIEGDINAAIAARSAAKTPAQRTAAAERIYTLTLQKVRLLGLLNDAKRRQMQSLSGQC
ncbi:relaxase/mobilization nuclease domain-containing protein [Herbaspirillum sp. RV1423]|uniref:relaxase/mobilization nuclease domain-containing protein n=1 Tax=Herbaspirillum sp. RV1423 TaxID=1443993 RepID=UPI001E50D3F8|nr:relaxase/mobilization nuclease domain-containing protein [Herbaspirillum sp. RV1423]